MSARSFTIFNTDALRHGEAQVLSYLRLADKPLGLLMNFNVPVLVKGVRRIMNGAHDAVLNSKT
jgi:hypothetical protein